ncbi:hypothetical protein EVAR_60546_1 [Eumeta japonica]|uniref:Uncharacterized protein n=1 Tax=Eumeta variegata TaxID=151549 RepID=A0A4C1YV34_EUMVA|nr:hypothetical protein EVAR_60546_1 [Eumeta japonica]
MQSKSPTCPALSGCLATLSAVAKCEDTGAVRPRVCYTSASNLDLTRVFETRAQVPPPRGPKTIDYAPRSRRRHTLGRQKLARLEYEFSGSVGLGITRIETVFGHTTGSLAIVYVGPTAARRRGL